jgi:hypothetical protein
MTPPRGDISTRTTTT